jgi:hypothetical protein
MQCNQQLINDGKEKTKYPAPMISGYIDLFDLYVLEVSPEDNAFIVKTPTFAENIRARALEERLIRWEGVDGKVRIIDDSSVSGNAKNDPTDADTEASASSPQLKKRKKKRKRRKIPQPSYLPDGSNGDSVPSPLPPSLNKYWHQRSRLLSKGSITPSPLFNITISSNPQDVTFTLSDSIIAERWYSVSPEIISRAMSGYLVHISPPAPSSTSPLALYVDPFAGVGQDTVSLSKSLATRSYSHLIFSCDLDLNCLLTTSYNLSLQKVPVDSVVLVWCNSVALARSLPTNFNYSISSSEARTKEGYLLVRFGPQPETSSADNFKSLWSALPLLELTSGNSTEVRGVFLSPPWNNTGFYDRGGGGRFTLQDDVVIGDGEGGNVTGMNIVDEWRAKVVRGGAVCTFVPNTWDPSELQRGASSDGGRTEVYRHLLNGKHKTGCVYFVK